MARIRILIQIGANPSNFNAFGSATRNRIHDILLFDNTEQKTNNTVHYSHGPH